MQNYLKYSCDDMSLESKFDGILHRGIPFLLFSPNPFKLKLSQKIGALYHLYQSNDNIGFYELYQSTINMLDNKEWFGTGRESDISRFTDDSKSFDERIVAHDKSIIDIKNHIKKFDNNSLLINKYYKELKKMYDGTSKREIKKDDAIPKPCYYWTDEENKVLIEIYPEGGLKACKNHPLLANRTKCAIINRAHSLKIRRLVTQRYRDKSLT